VKGRSLKNLFEITDARNVTEDEYIMRGKPKFNLRFFLEQK